jgi:hypothetical protein
MFVNRYQINLTTIESGATATTINVPINMSYQMVDQAELIQRVFVEVEVEKSVNPILDYEKVRFLPLDLSGAHMDRIIYQLDLFGATNYAAIGFTDDDIKFQKNSFKQTFLNLSFFDNDNPLTQRLVSNVTLFAELRDSDLLPMGTTTGIPGQPKPASQIPLTFVVENPILFPKGFSEGYHLYDYKDELKIGESKYLYMKASFKNAKTGTTTNLMVVNTATTIDNLVHLLYTRYKLIRNNTGYYYEIDDTYQGLTAMTGTNNVSYVFGPVNEARINLFKINAS